jgi:plasmid maintenance system killer protein
MEEIKLLDAAAKINTLNAAQWNERYEKERALEQIYSFEEIQW